MKCLIASSLVLWMGLSGGCAAAERQGKAVPAVGPLAATAFLTGHWKGEYQGGTYDELWSSDEGGVMTSTSKTIMGGRCVFFEFSRIVVAKDGRVTLLASPGGRNPPTAFPMTTSSGEGVTMTATFEKPDHDYPRLIRYTRTIKGNDVRLEAYLEGVEKGAAKSETILMKLVR